MKKVNKTPMSRIRKAAGDKQTKIKVASTSNRKGGAAPDSETWNNPKGTAQRKARSFTAEVKLVFLEIIKQNGGNAGDICRNVNISRTTFYSYLKKDKKFEMLFIREITSGLIDNIDAVLYNEAIKGNMVAMYKRYNRHLSYENKKYFKMEAMTTEERQQCEYRKREKEVIEVCRENNDPITELKADTIIIGYVSFTRLQG